MIGAIPIEYGGCRIPSLLPPKLDAGRFENCKNPVISKRHPQGNLPRRQRAPILSRSKLQKLDEPTRQKMSLCPSTPACPCKTSCRSAIAEPFPVRALDASSGTKSVPEIMAPSVHKLLLTKLQAPGQIMRTCARSAQFWDVAPDALCIFVIEHPLYYKNVECPVRNPG